MVYIYVRRKKDSKYYYLRKSVRENSTIVPKNICSLGKNLNKINLSQLEKQFPEIKKYEESIRRKLKQLRLIERASKIKSKGDKFFDEKQISGINSILSNFKKNFIKKRVGENFNFKFMAENVSIDSVEKHLPNKKDVSVLIKEDIYPKNCSVLQVYRLIETKKILDYLKEEKPNINTELVKKINSMLFERVIPLKGFRNHKLKVPGGNFKTSEAEKINSDMKKLISWYNKEKKKIHPLALAIIFHNNFEKIHPFAIGNGEVGRILMNYILELNGCPPILIDRKLKKEYYRVMDYAYLSLKKDLLNINMKYYKPLIDFMQKQFVKTYWDNFLD